MLVPRRVFSSLGRPTGVLLQYPCPNSFVGEKECLEGLGWKLLIGLWLAISLFTTGVQCHVFIFKSCRCQSLGMTDTGRGGDSPGGNFAGKISRFRLVMKSPRFSAEFFVRNLTSVSPDFHKCCMPMVSVFLGAELWHLLFIFCPSHCMLGSCTL